MKCFDTIFVMILWKLLVFVPGMFPLTPGSGSMLPAPPKPCTSADFPGAPLSLAPTVRQKSSIIINLMLDIWTWQVRRSESKIFSWTLFCAFVVLKNICNCLKVSSNVLPKHTFVIPSRDTPPVSHGLPNENSPVRWFGGLLQHSAPLGRWRHRPAIAEDPGLDRRHAEQWQQHHNENEDDNDNHNNNPNPNRNCNNNNNNNNPNRNRNRNRNCNNNNQQQQTKTTANS